LAQAVSLDPDSTLLDNSATRETVMNTRSCRVSVAWTLNV